MDEVESLGAIGVAAREELDNLTFVINCNLQRLDGPVRGNGKIIQELESYFRGAGWNVIKVIWGRDWDPLLAADRDGVLVNKMNTTPDGQFQTYTVESGAYIRENFFGGDPRLRKMVEDLSDDELRLLSRGGHDYRKVYAAFALGPGARRPADGDPGPHHQGLDAGELRGPQRHPPDEEADQGRPEGLPGPALPADQRRGAGGRPAAVLPPGREVRRDPVHEGAPGGPRRLAAQAGQPVQAAGAAAPAGRRAYADLKKGSGKQQVATTQVIVRLFKDLMRDKEIGNRFVPIIPDEARTFGLDAIFPTAKIYSPHGQEYDAVDRDMLLSYKESTTGQILHEGISEAGSTASLIAAGTSYATHGQPMIPFYIFYSMFGFQRTGDQFWQFADQLGRGFVLGATAGRTTLTGEGLQHADGHSLLLASTNPAAVAYDPAYAYEIAHIVESGLRRMYGSSEQHPHGEDVFFYLTIYNEPIPQPAEPADVDVEGILRGIHLVSAGARRAGPAARPGAGLRGGGAVGAAGPGTARPGLGRGRRRLVGDVVERAATRCAAADEHNLLHPDAEPHTPVRRRASWPTPAARWWRCRTTCARCPTRSRSGCRARTGSGARSAPTASASPTPGARPAGSSTSTPSRSW